MIAGIGFLTVVTAGSAATFIEASRQRRADSEDLTMTRLDEIIARLDRLEEASSRRRPSEG